MEAEEQDLNGLQQFAPRPADAPPSAHHKRAASEDPELHSLGSNGAVFSMGHHVKTGARRQRGADSTRAFARTQQDVSPPTSAIHAQSQHGIQTLTIEQVTHLTQGGGVRASIELHPPEQEGPRDHPFESLPQPMLANSPDRDQPTFPLQAEDHIGPAHGPGFLDGPDRHGSMDAQVAELPGFPATGPITIYPPSFSDSDSQLLSESPASHTDFAHRPRSVATAGPASAADPLAAPLPLTARSLSGFSDRSAGAGTAGEQSAPQSPAQGSLQGGLPAAGASGGANGAGGGSVNGQPPNQSPFSPPGAWSAWWTASRGHPAAAYGGNLGAWLQGGRPTFAQTDPNTANALLPTQPGYPSGPPSHDGSCVSDLATNQLRKGIAALHRKESGLSSRASSWSFDSAEQLAIEAADHTLATQQPAAAPADVGGGAFSSAAAARAAARRDKAARASPAAQGGAGPGSEQQAYPTAHGFAIAPLQQQQHQPNQVPNPRDPNQPHQVTGQQHMTHHDDGCLMQEDIPAPASEHAHATQPAIAPAIEWGAGGAQPAVIGVQRRPQGRTGYNNARMHPNNKYYNEEPDFVKLSAQFPDLKKYMSVSSNAGGRCSYNFASWEATRQLTAALLAADFNVHWWLPEGQLVPTITNRLNYLNWINDLLALSSPPGQEEVRGLDIGCGANYIYCLLGASVYGWHMVGADITDVAITWANHNRENNRHLHSLLEVRRTSQPQATDTPAASAMSAGAPSDACDTAGGGGGAGDATAESGGGKAVAKRPPSPAHAAGPVGNALGHAQHAGQHAGHHAGQPGVGNEGDNGGCGEQPESDPGGVLTPAFNSPSEVFAFTMCNPPFFNSITEANSNPNTACGGTEVEMVYPGGELAFIMRMVEDSVRLGPRVHWYTSMVGKKATLKALRKELHTRHVTAIRTTEFAQGKTSRWAIAWSFDVDRNLANVPLTRPVNPTLTAPTIARKAITFPLKAAKMDARGVLQLINNLLTTQGATCSVDAALWRITAVLPPEQTDAAGGTSTSAAAPAGASAARAAAGGKAGAGATGAAAAGKGGAVTPRTAADLADVAEAALFAELSRGGDGPTSGNTMMQATKKARGLPNDAGTIAAAAAAAAGAHRALSLRVNVFQQQRGQLEISASIANNSSDEDAARFTQLMGRVQADLQAMCS